MSTSALIDGGMTTLYHAAAQGRAQANVDFVQSHDELIGCSRDTNVKTMRIYCNHPLELHKSITTA